MERFENTFDILAPVATCYAEWIRFELHPQIMDQVKSVNWLGNNQWRWIVHEPFGRELVCDVEIHTDDAKRVIAWETPPSSPISMKGHIHFEEITPGRTRVHYVIDYPVSGASEVHDATVQMSNSVKQMVDRALKSFKYTVENNLSKNGADIVNQASGTASQSVSFPSSESTAGPLPAEPSETLVENARMAGLEDDLFSGEENSGIIVDFDELIASTDDPAFRKLRREEDPYLGLSATPVPASEDEIEMRSDSLDDDEFDLFSESMDIDEEDLANFTEDLDDDIDGALPAASRYTELSFEANAVISSESNETEDRPKTSRSAE